MHSSSERGFVLVPAVWLAGLIGIALSAFLMEIRTDTRAAANLISNAKAEFLADGLVRVIAFDLAARGMSPTSGQVAKCRLNREFFALLRVQDQAGLVDLNAASGATLQELGRILGLDPSSVRNVADRIMDFRDQDDSPQPNGAEAKDYRAAGLSYLPKNKPFEDVYELRQVMGLSNAEFELLRSFVTVQSVQDGIDPTVAPGKLKLSEGSKIPIVTSQQQSFAVDVLVLENAGAGFYRHALIRVLRRPDRPFAILEWDIGRSEDASMLRDAVGGECPLPSDQAVIR
jgi:general secretion pathway protein K